MARDLLIRLLGRPQVTEDSALGYRKITRRYVVEGNRASKEGIEGDVTKGIDALFLAVGTPDEEFTDHYLVNQRIEPSKTVDKAYLIREYAHIRDSWASESASESGDLKKITRRYTVLRANHSLGYDTNEWNRHPTKGRGDPQRPELLTTILGIIFPR